MISENLSEPRKTLETLVDSYFNIFPDPEEARIAANVEVVLFRECSTLNGKINGWAGGLVYLVHTQLVLETSYSILNADMQECFQTSIGTIRKRSEQIWQICEPFLSEILGESSEGSELSIRDEANALCAIAFRNGPLEDIHASCDSDGQPKISDPEMKELMINSSSKLAELLELKQRSVGEYYELLRKHHRIYCRAWER